MSLIIVENLHYLKISNWTQQLKTVRLKMSKAQKNHELIMCEWRNGAGSLAKPISELCNLSTKLESFPDAYRLPKVKWLFKTSSKTKPSNRRPIFLLPLSSKVSEKVVLDQTKEFVNLNKVLQDHQPSFREKHSTDTCLSFLNDKILKGFDDILLTGIILIDLQKAFDTINHDILLREFSIIGFSDDTVKWFRFCPSICKFAINSENCFFRNFKHIM